MYTVLDKINQDVDTYDSFEKVKEGLRNNAGGFTDAEYNKEIESINNISNDSDLNEWLRERDMELK